MRGRAPAGAANWREKMLAEAGPRIDTGRLHFTGKIPYPSLISLLQSSRAHVYLTYPFVLSWSLLEAMAVGAPIAASATAPVNEVLQHGSNGLLFDFFDGEALVESVCRLLDDVDLRRTLGSAAHCLRRRSRQRPVSAEATSHSRERGACGSARRTGVLEKSHEQCRGEVERLLTHTVSFADKQ